MCGLRIASVIQKGSKKHESNKLEVSADWRGSRDCPLVSGPAGRCPVVGLLSSRGFLGLLLYSVLLFVLGLRLRLLR